MHLDDEQVQRLLHREFPERAERATREHIAACAACRRRLGEAEEEEHEVNRLLGLADEPPPSIRAETVALMAELNSAAERTRGAAWLRRAAGLALAVGIAGAAYAVPGSPLRQWVHAVAERIAGRPEPPRSAPPSSAPSSVSGIAMPPGEKLVVRFQSSQAEGEVTVSIIEGSEVQVRAPVGAATFTSGADQLLIGNRASSASFEILIPRSAPWVEIRVGDDRVFLKEGTRVITRASRSAAGYVLRFAPAGSLPAE